MSKNRLRFLREKKGLTSEQLAEVLGLNGSSLRCIERGDRGFSTGSLNRACEYFGVSVDYMLGKSPEEMFNGFVDSLHDDFIIETSHGGDDVVQSLSPVVPEPVRTKIEILLLLRGINNKDSLDLILEFTKMRTAHDDFAEPLKED